VRRTVERRAIGLLSGGLDSVLAIRMVKDEGVEVIALHIRLPFVRKTSESPEAAAEWLGVRLVTAEVGEDYIDVLRNPKFGYGKAFNPCIDCRVYMLGVARRVMEAEEASFVITGDVLKQRPKSQRPDALRIEDKYSGLDGLILRPLSAQLLEPTIPEKEGIVRREVLLGLSGRSRSKQFELAEEYGLKRFSTPAGGCPLTDPRFGEKIRALLTHVPRVTIEDLALLRKGRHFYTESAHIIVGRSLRENRALVASRSPDDVLLGISEYGGPVTLVRGRVDCKALAQAARLTALYSDAPCDAVVTVHYHAPTGTGAVLVEQSSAVSGPMPSPSLRC